MDVISFAASCGSPAWEGEKVNAGLRMFQGAGGCGTGHTIELEHVNVVPLHHGQCGVAKSVVVSLACEGQPLLVGLVAHDARLTAGGAKQVTL